MGEYLSFLDNDQGRFKKQQIWEMLKAILPHYLEVFTGEDDKGVPNVNFHMAITWARETAEHSFDMVYNTEKTDEQKSTEQANDSLQTEASTEAQTTQSGEVGQVAS